MPWSLVCSGCGARRAADGLATVCDACGQPWLVEYERLPAPGAERALDERDASMWRYREWLPLRPGETPVTLGEGFTPLLEVPSLAREIGVARLLVKDESQNPTGSFKARGLSAAVTRARAAGAAVFTVPTAGNAGVALSAYGRRAGLPVHVFAPRTTPPRIVEQARLFGARVELLDGHIGDCGNAARRFAAEDGAFDLSTLREPYRIEGKKTLGLELAEQLGWRLPNVVVYPTGGGTGLIGMWKAFEELRAAGWLADPSPVFVSVQATGCAPVVRAFEAGADETMPWEDPRTVASGLRVPNPLGGRLILRALRETGGKAVQVSDERLTDGQARLAQEGIDAAPEGGATVAGLRSLMKAGEIDGDATVVLFNTGAGWLYRGD
jgi:threonine synthase